MLTDYFFVFSCSDKYQNIYLFFQFKIRKKNWAKWAKWARILKSTLTNEQLHSGTCFLVFACSNKHQYTSLLILLEIIENQKKIQFGIFVKKSLKNHNSKNICPRDFCLAPNERELSNLLTLSISFEGPFARSRA